MTSSMLYGAENLAIIRGRVAANGLGFNGSELNVRKFPLNINLTCGNSISRGKTLVVPKCSVSLPRPASQPRFIQHKKEAFWFYRFLSIVYDHVINPGHWTEDMRDEALEPADLYSRNMIVVDVGGGTGFTTLGIVKHVDAKNVTILDQSPHQLAKAKQKEPLKECKIIEGDAEDLPFETDYADRYISAGSIEYWPDPQRGIREAYRVLKIGGKACIIGPVYPTYWLSRFFADMWMLFPKEEEYIEWFEKAGFKDVKIKRIGPKWYRGVRRHGLIMGCSVTGVKPASGDSPLQVGPRESKDRERFPPNNILLMLLGAGLLWMGWTGFNGGDPYMASRDASLAVLNTHVCAAMSLLTWLMLDIMFFEKPSVIGATQGMITGLVCITPAAGVVQGWAAIIMGLLSGSIPWFTMMVVHKQVSLLKEIDDTMAVFHTHAVAGSLGGVLTGFFAEPRLNRIFFDITDGWQHYMGLAYGLKTGQVRVGLRQMGIQLLGILFVVVWNIVITSLICVAIRVVMPLRLSEEELQFGDEEVHGESAYALWGDGEKLLETSKLNSGHGFDEFSVKEGSNCR